MGWAGDSWDNEPFPKELAEDNWLFTAVTDNKTSGAKTAKNRPVCLVIWESIEAVQESHELSLN